MFINRDNFSLTVKTALWVGSATILLVLLIGKASGNPLMYWIGDLISTWGNKLFLYSTNILIIAWAWRKRLWNVIYLVIGLNVLVLLLVHGAKLTLSGPWTIRPHGGTGGLPSGHAAHSFAMAFMSTLFFPRFVWLWYPYAAIISWSRIETLAHNSFQISSGIVLGLLISWVIATRWMKYLEAKAPAPQVTNPAHTTPANRHHIAE